MGTEGPCQPDIGASGEQSLFLHSSLAVGHFANQPLTIHAAWERYLWKAASRADRCTLELGLVALLTYCFDYELPRGSSPCQTCFPESVIIRVVRCRSRDRNTPKVLSSPTGMGHRLQMTANDHLYANRPESHSDLLCGP